MNLVFASDNNGFNMLAVAVYSVIKHNSAEELNFHIIHSKITRQNQQRLKRLEKKFPFTSIVFHKVDARFFESISLDSETVTKEAFYRYMAADLLRGESRALYMDIDMLCLDSLADLYNTDLGNEYFGVVEDYFVVHHDGFKGFREAIKFEDKKFFNSGMLLMNLRALREADILKTFWDNSKNKSKFIPDPYNTYADQTIANITFEGRVKFLPLKYNALLTALGHTKIKHVVIAHFTGLAKPYSLHDTLTEPFDYQYYQYYFEGMHIIGDDGSMILAALKGLAGSIHGLRDNISRLSDEVSTLRAENESLQSHSNELSGYNEQLEKEAETARTLLNDIRGSMSWRLTQPLRSVTSVLRHIIKK